MTSSDEEAKAALETIAKRRVYHAIFEDWILPHNQVLHGQFKVEVHENFNGRSLKWKARLIPTGQRFGGISHNKSDAACAQVASQFKKVVKPWEEK
jgi:hypothetical protein